MATDYGTDVSTYPDLDPTFTVISGQQVVAQAIARRLETPRTSLADDPNCGFDLRQQINAKWTRARLYEVKTGIEREALKDERVFSAACALSFTPATRALTATIELETMYGPFDLVLSIDAVTVAILSPT